MVKEKELYPIFEKKLFRISAIRENETRKVTEILNDPHLKNWSRYVLEQYLISLYLY